MKRHHLKFWLFISFIVSVLCFSQSVTAEDMAFSVSTKQSQSQLDKTKSYYDLRVKPGTTEDLEVDIQNKTDKEITVSILANTAVTNNNGVIDYSQVSPKLDEALQVPFSSLVDDIPDVTLKANEKKTISIPIHIPKEPFNGIILGGLHFFEKTQEAPKQDKKEIQVGSTFSYVIGVKLSENDDKIPVKINLLDIKANQRNYKNVISAKLENPEPRILSHLEIKADVYSAKNQQEPIYSRHAESLSMAPYSSFEYDTPLKDDVFKAGDYILHLVAKTNNQEFEFEEPFHITKEEAEKFNSTVIGVKDKSNTKKIIIMLVVLVLVVIILLVILLLRKHKASNSSVAKTERQKRMLANKKGQTNKSLFSTFKLTKKTKVSKSTRHERLSDKNKRG